MEKVEGGKLTYDLNSIMEFINSSNNNNNISEISEIYEINEDGALELISKNITENKSKNDADITIRYDIIKGMMESIYNITNQEVITLGETLAFNTFVSHGFIKDFTK